MILAAALFFATSTAYSPCSSGSVMANGQPTSWGSIANNQLRLGTRVRFQRPIHGRRVFTVRDRGGMRSFMAVDVWMPSCRAAVQYGRRRVTFRVLRGRS